MSREFSRRHDDNGCGVALTAIVDEITAENDDSYRTGNGPVSAAVRYEPFVKPFAQLAPASRYLHALVGSRHLFKIAPLDRPASNPSTAEWASTFDVLGCPFGRRLVRLQ